MTYNPILKPEEIPHRFAEAWNDHNPDGIAALFYEDADFVNVTGKWWDNKSDIWKAHDFGLRVIFRDSKAEVLKVKVKSLTDEVAVVHCHFKVTGQTVHKTAKEAGVRETMFLFVAKRENNGEWLCVSAQNTDIISEKQTHIRDEKGKLKAVSYKEKIVLKRGDINKEK